MPKGTTDDSLDDRKVAFSAMIDAAINSSIKPKIQIANEIGYTINANMLTMVKRGTSRLPLDKVVPFANAVGEEPGKWLRMWFEAYTPDLLLADLEQYIGNKLSRHEQDWVRGLRKLFGNSVPTFEENLINVNASTPAQTA